LLLAERVGQTTSGNPAADGFETRRSSVLPSGGSQGGLAHSMTQRSCERLIRERLLRPVETHGVNLVSFFLAQVCVAHGLCFDWLV
jgi:hypothetical protein